MYKFDRGEGFSEESGRARGCGLQNNHLIKCCLEYLKAYMAYLAKLALVGLAQLTWLGVLG